MNKSCLQTATMADEPMQTLTTNELLKNSSLYREFQAEREEILRHKWIESEKAGRILGSSGRSPIGLSSTVRSGDESRQPSIRTA